MDKWLSNTPPEGKPPNKKDVKNKIPKEKMEEFKKRKINELIGKKSQPKNKVEKIELKSRENDFLSYVIEFKEWLNKRNYLKGDLDKIESWIKNLYLKLDEYLVQESTADIKAKKTQIKDEYKDIPPTFLDEKTRIAINKKIRGTKKTSSDTYYLRKLKETLTKKLKEARYYEILKRILEI